VAAPNISQSPIKVPITRPALGKAEADAASRVVKSGWIFQGPEVAAFETELAAAVGAPAAVAVSSGTTALELTLRALGVGPGDDVITVSHSFIATANVVVAIGARPVFVDVERDTFSMDPAAVPSAVGPRTKAILVAHQLGFAADLPALTEIASAHGVPLIEDAACALGTEIDAKEGWERIGRPHGVAACFSFHPRKIITTGDGGMITTRDSALASKLRSWRQHGLTISAEVRNKDPLARESYADPAFNFRLTDLQAAVGRPQLARLEQYIADRRRLAESFHEELVDHPVLCPPMERLDVRTNWQSYPTLIRDESELDQEQMLRFLLDRGIAGRRGISNAHQEPAYAGRDNWRGGGPLPISEMLRDRTVMLPLYHGMGKDEERLVRQAIADLRDPAARAPYR